MEFSPVLAALALVLAMVTEIPAQDWKALLRLAMTVDEMAPWRWLTDAQVFAVHPAAVAEPVFCSVMGQGDSLKGLALYPGREGWQTYVRIGQSSADEDPLEALCLDRCALLQLVPVGEASQDDLALLSAVGVEPGAVVPSFNCYSPGYAPQAPDAAEMAWLLPVLREVVHFLGDLPGSGEVVPETGQNDLGRILARKQVGDAFVLDWILPGSAQNFSPETVKLSEEEARVLRDLPVAQEVWLFEDVHLPEPQEDGSGRAFFPRAVILLGLEDQQFRGASLLRPQDFPGALGQVLMRQMLQVRAVPANLVVARPANMILLRPFCQALGIGIHLETEMDIRPSLREALMES